MLLAKGSRWISPCRCLSCGHGPVRCSDTGGSPEVVPPGAPITPGSPSSLQ